MGELERINQLLLQRWSPEQISGRLAASASALSISHETIYRHVWRDKKRGGSLYIHLRCAQKRRRKGYGHYDSRGRLAGKRHISERPDSVESRRELGYWEIDTVMGTGSKDCILSLVERKTGLLLIGKLANRTTEALNERAIELIAAHRGPFNTITADNGTEFHRYADIESRTHTTFFFATPDHAASARIFQTPWMGASMVAEVL